MGPFDKASLWLKGQAQGFVDANAAFGDRQLASQEELRAGLSGLTVPWMSPFEHLAAAKAPRKDAASEVPLRGPIYPSAAIESGDPYASAEPRDFAGNATWRFPSDKHFDWNRRDPARQQGDGRFGLGYRRNSDGTPRRHDGVDVTMPEGTPVYADRDGQVFFSGTQTGYGLTIEAGPTKPDRSQYAHLSESFVKSGQAVKKGDLIGKSGRSGNLPKGASPHLHYEIYRGGERIDPYRAFLFEEASPNPLPKP